MIRGKVGKRLKQSLPAAVLLSLLVFPISSLACSLASCVDNGVELQRDFVVSVTHGGKPLARVTVQVTRYGEEIDNKLFSGMTATDGTVHVPNLPPGEYWLDAGLLGITAGSQCFHVANHASRKARRTVKYEWGDLAPSTRQIAGRLIDPQPGEGVTFLQNIRNGVVAPISETKLKLQNALTGDVYDALSNDDGGFSFAQIPNGTYVLRIEGGKTPAGRNYESTDLLIRLSDAATNNLLLLKRTSGGAGSCGGPSLAMELLSTPN
jgi:hypothetical protein